MIPLPELLTFFGASVLLAIAPGPDNVFVMAQGALYGPRAGLLVTLGLCTGLVIHTAAVALGLAAAIQSSDWAFSVLKSVGAIYLLYLAYQALTSQARSPTSEVVPESSSRGLYFRGIVMNVTNPKVSIFFLAFLPQFADPSRGPLWRQIAALGAVFAGATLLIFGLIALAAGTVGRWLKNSPTAQIWLQRIAGAVFALLALRLIFAKK